MAERIQTLLTAERRLLQDVSHELRSPLTRLAFALELAEEGKDREDALARARRENEQMAVLVDELLKLTRAEGDPANRLLSTVSLRDLLEELVDTCSLEADAQDCRLVCRMEGHALVRGQPELLRRAIDNILRNAIRHAPAGTSVEITLKLEGERASIVVRDFGAGAPAELLEHLVRPFFRVETDRDRASGGVGLGLAIAERAVRVHQGALTLRNANPGLEVLVLLPGAWAETSAAADLVSNLGGVS